MNPDRKAYDPLQLSEDYDAAMARWEELKRERGYILEPELPRRRDARLVILAFAGMAVIAAVAWALQQ